MLVNFQSSVISRFFLQNHSLKVGTIEIEGIYSALMRVDSGGELSNRIHETD